MVNTFAVLSSLTQDQSALPPPHFTQVNLINTKFRPREYRSKSALFSRLMRQIRAFLTY